ncbi:hypothetical protein [Saccharothrix sp. Mg75]
MDVICGLGGNDTIYAGDDGTGADTLHGGPAAYLVVNTSPRERGS